MNILFLGYKNSSLIPFLKKDGNRVWVTEEKITPSFVRERHIDWIISYGYRHILRKDILSLLPERILNLHISFLPYNRGADPNFWSFVEQTPKGVSIHYIDEGIDTGDVLIRKEMTFSHQETLRTTYEQLQKAIEELFMKHWQDIKKQKIHPIKQIEPGTYHKKNDKLKLIEGIEDKYLDMKISELLNYISKKQKNENS